MLLLVCFCNAAHSQRIMAGEISYTHVTNFTYEFRINTLSETIAGGLIYIIYGDGTSDYVLASSEYTGEGKYYNTYLAEHTYAGPGMFQVYVNCGPMVEGIKNIPESITKPFTLVVDLVIFDYLTLGYNSSPVCLTALNDYTIVNGICQASFNDYDPDGDSLDFELCNYNLYPGIPYSTIPPATNYIGIEPLTGDFIWDQPVEYGLYLIHIKVNEFRGGIYFGSTMRTLMIDYNSELEPDDIQLYPVPADEIVSLDFNYHYFRDYTIEIMNEVGQHVLHLNSSTQNPDILSIDVSGLPAAVYYLNFRSESLTKTFRLVKL